MPRRSWADGRRPRGASEEPAILVLDNAPTGWDLAALQFLAEKHIIVVILPPRLAHVMQPIDVCRAHSFKRS
jgi:hypothetical protein